VQTTISLNTSRRVDVVNASTSREEVTDVSREILICSEAGRPVGRQASRPEGETGGGSPKLINMHVLA